MYIIGLAGGSCSGKTFLTSKIANKFSEKIVIIELDSYYFDLSHLKMSEREKNNFDHPSSFDFNLLINDLNTLKNDGEVQIPIYNYKKHIRTSKKQIVEKKKIVIVEVILALHNSKLRKLMNLKGFLDTPPKIRKNIRLKRDVCDRARTSESIYLQYKNTVEPMYYKYVNPCKKFADIIIKNNSFNNNAYNILSKEIQSILN